MVAKKDIVTAALAVWYMATAATYTGRELCCRGGFRAASYATTAQARLKARPAAPTEI